MFSNRVFVFLTLALSGLYYVVTVLQFWVTDYMTVGDLKLPATLAYHAVCVVLSTPLLRFVV